jgi:fatty-acid peroxygenase
VKWGRRGYPPLVAAASQGGRRHAAGWRLRGDRTLALALEGYDFVGNRCDRLGTDAFETTLMLQPAVCLRGPEAAAVFYDPQRFVRAGAFPMRIQRTLVGVGGVQTMDGAAHRHRKHMFMTLLTGEGVERLAGLFVDEWRSGMRRWSETDRIVLLDESARVLCRAVCSWAGVPLEERDVARRTAQLRALVEAPAAVGPRHWRGRRARSRLEGWLADLVDGVRAGSVAAPPGSALTVVAEHRGLDGQLLDRRTAAVELLNVLRPTVAVDRFITFLAVSLHEHPAAAAAVGGQGNGEERFVQEVRRTSPFFPVAAARVHTAFEWRGVDFAPGQLVLLDLYGTNRHPRRWAEPGRFDPDRFVDRPDDPYDFIPQGGGTHHGHHRCPGEGVTVALMRAALTLLTEEMEYDVPPQDLRVSRRRVPARPRSGMVLSAVRPRT